MFTGIATPYRSPSPRLRRSSLKPEEDDHDDDGSTCSTSMDYSSDHRSQSSDQGFPEFLKINSPHKIKRQAQRTQDFPRMFNPKPLESPSKSPHLNPVSLAHQESLSNRTKYSIKGLGVAQSLPQAMFRPSIRVYPPPYGRPDKSNSTLDYLRASPFVDHIDIATVWKGLLLRDAEQILYLDRTFKDCIEDILADALFDMHEEFQQQCASRHDRNSGASIISLLKRQLSFTLRHLVLIMSQRLKSCRNPLERGPTQDFEALIPLFLVSRDCLMGFEGESLGDTAVDICVRYCDSSNDVYPIRPTTEAAWIPDMLSFNEINQFQREGEELIIVPCYCGNAAFAANITRTDIQYSIEPPEPWLTWDESISGFRGIVPLISDAGCVRRPGKVYRSYRDGPDAITNILQVEIRAILTAGYRSRTRLQKTIRVRLTFKILPQFANGCPSTPRNDPVTPPYLHYLNCDFPASLSISSRSVEKNEHESARDAIASDDGSFSVSSPSSRAASGLEIMCPMNRHREDENKLISRIQELSITPHEEVDGCHSRSTTPGASSFCSIWTLQSRDNLPPMGVEGHIVHVDVGKTPEVNDSKMVSVGAMPVDERPSTPVATEMTLDPIYDLPNDHAKSDAEADFAQKGKFSIQQVISPRIIPLDGNATSWTSQSKRLPTDELCNSTLSAYNDASVCISNRLQSSHDGFCGSMSGSHVSSSTMDMIVENPNDGPRMRRDQAVLWNVLSIREAQSNDKGETMSVDELKDMCSAMTKSVREEEVREMAKMSFTETFDDIFISSGSNSDIEMEESNDK